MKRRRALAWKAILRMRLEHSTCTSEYARGRKRCNDDEGAHLIVGPGQSRAGHSR